MMTPPIQIKKGDRVYLDTDQRWYTVTRGTYWHDMSFRSMVDTELACGVWAFDGDGKVLQPAAVGEVWRGEQQIYPPVAEQLSLFEGM